MQVKNNIIYFCSCWNLCFCRSCTTIMSAGLVGIRISNAKDALDDAQNLLDRVRQANREKDHDSVEMHSVDLKDSLDSRLLKMKLL